MTPAEITVVLLIGFCGAADRTLGLKPAGQVLYRGATPSAQGFLGSLREGPWPRLQRENTTADS